MRGLRGMTTDEGRARHGPCHSGADYIEVGRARRPAPKSAALLRKGVLGLYQHTARHRVSSRNTCGGRCCLKQAWSWPPSARSSLGSPFSRRTTPGGTGALPNRGSPCAGCPIPYCRDCAQTYGSLAESVVRDRLCVRSARYRQTSASSACRVPLRARMLRRRRPSRSIASGIGAQDGVAPATAGAV